IFDALSTEDLPQIVALQVSRLGRRLAARRLALQVTPAAREWLAVTGFDPIYGARPLRRLIQSAIGDQLARALLARATPDGDLVVVALGPASDKRTVRGSPPASAAPAGSGRSA